MAIKVLVVLDGDFRFDSGAVPAGTADFTFKTLTDTLTLAGFQVTKANRSTDSTADIGWDSFDFSAHNLLAFDVIWLIGRAGRNSIAFPPVDDPGSALGDHTTAGGLGQAQHDAIANFMEAGGGVFGVGDHDSIGADMCGFLPRVRLMRRWYGQNDGARPAALASLPDNFPPLTATRMDTTQSSPNSVYTGHPAPFVWFENQSDSVPQPLTVVHPTHPILLNNGADITVYPDHMHEGSTLGKDDLAASFFTMSSPFGDTSKDEFRSIAGGRQLPEVIATDQSLAHGNFSASGEVTTDSTQSLARSNNALSVYDGRVAGVGRIVTGATFHHYIDINLTGDSAVTMGTVANAVGSDAMKGNGLNLAAPGDLQNIKAVYVNITNWLARPQPAIGLILEVSTFSQAAVTANPKFEGAVLLTVDGLKPSQFPGGGVPGLGPISGSPAWVPQITVPVGIPIAIEPTFVSSDDPTMPMPDRLQRFTFTYRVHFTGDAFSGFAGTFSDVPVQATLSPAGLPGPLTDSATIVLVKSANPYMLDLADGSTTTWLSSDVKVFHVVAGDPAFLGIDALPAGADRNAALTFLRNIVAGITDAQFTNLDPSEDSSTSALSSLDTTTQSPHRRVYNFALARVRLNSHDPDANPVRVFFRIFTTQTTAALTYNLDGMGNPIGGYLRTPYPNPIDLPGTQNGGMEWVSFPCFSNTRSMPQTDGDNSQAVFAATGFRIFGALIDNNLNDLYLTQTPLGGPMESLATLTMGEHQCVVVQVEYQNAPIPDGATPWTSDKLSQRNLAVHPIANPGLDPSRVAMHTFEIEATPHAITDTIPPDELVLNWPVPVPAGTVLRVHIPTWSAQAVVDLADRFYARHEIVAVDDNTIEIPGGGTRYLPIPMSLSRQTGVIAAEFPLGVKRGQRFDVSVRQITNRFRNVQIPPPRVQKISLAEAERIKASVPEAPTGARGVDLGNNRVLITDLSVFDARSDHALIIEHPDPAVVKAAIADSAQWREPIGAFQLAVPVSTKDEMLLYHMRLLSVMRWRTAQLSRQNRWYDTMVYYLDLLTDKVAALGGNPFTVPPTPDGDIPQLHGGDGAGGSGVAGGGGGITDQTIAQLVSELLGRPGCWLLLIFLIVLLLVVWYFFR